MSTEDDVYKLIGVTQEIVKTLCAISDRLDILSERLDILQEIVKRNDELSYNKFLDSIPIDKRFEPS